MRAGEFVVRSLNVLKIAANTIYRYSLQYGQRLAGLSADISKSEVRNFDSLLKETKKVGQQYMKDF